MHQRVQCRVGRAGARVTYGLLLAVAALAAGCLGADDGVGPAQREASDAAPVHLELLSDTAGDARDLHPAMGEDLLDDACDDDPCEDAEDLLGGTGDGALGAPAPPLLDILGASVTAASDGLDVRLDLASVDKTLNDAVSLDGEYGSFFELKWGDACEYGVYLGVLPVNGRVVLEPIFFHSHHPCGEVEDGDLGSAACLDFRVCASRVSVEFVPGAPGSIVWHVPWAVVPPEASATNFDGVRAATGRHGHWAGPSAGVYWGVGHLDTYGSAYATDEAGPGDGVGSALPARPAGGPRPVATGTMSWEPLFLDPDAEATDPRADILAATLRETPGELAVQTLFADVRSDPGDIVMNLGLAFPGGAGVEILVAGENGERAAGAYLGFPDGSARAIPVSVASEPGTPGTVTVVLSRADLPPTRAGDRLGLAYVDAWAIDYRAADIGVTQVETWVQAGEGTGFSGVAPAYWYAFDSAEVTDVGGRPAAAAIEDAVGDHRSVVLSGSDPYLDLTYVTAGASAIGVSEIELGLDGWSSTPVPPGYAVTVYATALRTNATTVLVAYYRQADQETGESFCAQDTLVTAGDRDLPPRDLWRPVETVIRAGVAGRAGPDAAGSSITFQVPHDCFGPDAPPVAHVEAMLAGVYVARTTAVAGAGAPLEYEEMDAAAHEDAFALDTQEAAAAPSFWSQPFGLDNFWDIAGIVLAVVTVLATAAIVLRRRRALRRYLAEVARLEAAHADDPDGLASALVALRHELHDDLLRHRISENHYPIVAERLRSRITGARIESLGEAYYELPGPLARRIERVLDDGRLTPSEHGTIAGLVGAAPLEQAKRRALVDRLARWLAEDGRLQG